MENANATMQDETAKTAEKEIIAVDYSYDEKSFRTDYKSLDVIVAEDMESLKIAERIEEIMKKKYPDAGKRDNVGKSDDDGNKNNSANIYTFNDGNFDIAMLERDRNFSLPGMKKYTLKTEDTDLASFIKRKIDIQNSMKGGK